MKYFYTLEQLAESVKASTSIVEVMRRLGIPWSGGSHNHLVKKIKKKGYDMSHFLGQGHSKGKKSRFRKPPEFYLQSRPMIEGRQKSFKLRRCLIEKGKKVECEICGNQGVWNGKKLNLEMDHINRINTDDRFENLRFLCPNCHSQN